MSMWHDLLRGPKLAQPQVVGINVWVDGCNSGKCASGCKAIRSIDARKCEKLLLQDRILQITFEQSKRSVIL